MPSYQWISSGIISLGLKAHARSSNCEKTQELRRAEMRCLLIFMHQSMLFCTTRNVTHSYAQRHVLLHYPECYDSFYAPLRAFLHYAECWIFFCIIRRVFLHCTNCSIFLYIQVFIIFEVEVPIECQRYSVSAKPQIHYQKQSAEIMVS